MKIEFTPCLIASGILLTFGCQEQVQQEQVEDNLDHSKISEEDAVLALARENDTGSSPDAFSRLLVPGSKAPAIDLTAVVHGPEVRPFSGEHVVVVEFWATWCGPCLASMPHISTLQQQYGAEVQFIGVTDEEEQTVTEFLETEAEDGEIWREILSYTIAIDRNHQTRMHFMQAAQQRRIPCAFVINKAGQVAWIGHPAEIESPLIEIVRGTWDIEDARQQFVAAGGPSVTPNRPVQVESVLELGKSAPPVQLVSVVHGKPFDGIFADGKVFVVEFWATWCGPCLASMPHISTLQQFYGDAVQFVGVTSEDLETVAEFLQQTAPGGEKRTDLIRYSLALDDAGKTYASYMDAARQQGIPCAFIVDQSGEIAWYGHPMEIDEPLQAVVSGTYDVESEAVVFRAEHQLRAAVNDSYFTKALELLEELSKSRPDRLRYPGMRLELLSQLGQWPQYNQLAAAVVSRLRAPTETGEHSTEDNTNEIQRWGMLNGIAWEIAAIQTGDLRDLDLAMEAAMMASDATGHTNPAVLDTVARVCYEQGNVPQAVEWQKKAVQKMRRLDPDQLQLAQQLRETLAYYESVQSGTTSEEDGVTEGNLTTTNK